MAHGIDGSGRMLTAEADRHPVRAEWEYTIADIYEGGRSTGAAQRVRHWAEVVRS